MFLLVPLESCLFNNFDLESIKKIAEKEKPHSVSEFLASKRIPKEMRRKFSPLNFSGSAQPGTPECPRVLVYSADTKTVISFNCGTLYADEDEKHAADSIEIAQANPETNEYELYSLHLSSDSDPVLSEKNPALCLTCHHSEETPFIGRHWHFMTEDEIRNLLDIVSNNPESETAKRYRQLDWENRVDLREIQSSIIENWSPIRLNKKFYLPEDLKK